MSFKHLKEPKSGFPTPKWVKQVLQTGLSKSVLKSVNLHKRHYKDITDKMNVAQNMWLNLERLYKFTYP